MYQWVVTSTPDGVDFEDVTFLSPNAEETYVTVPLEGDYDFAVTCLD